MGNRGEADSAIEGGPEKSFLFRTIASAQHRTSEVNLCIESFEGEPVGAFGHGAGCSGSSIGLSSGRSRKALEGAFWISK
jgi:hypothetical protein